MDFKDLRRAWRYRAGRFLVETTTRLPIPVGRRLYGMLGRLAFMVVRRDRQIALANLRMAFPDWSEPRVRRTAGTVFEELLKNIFDVAAFPRWPEPVRARELKIKGTAHLAGALAAGRGAILLANHQGAWELTAAGLVRAGFHVEAFSRPIAEPRLERWLTEHRRALGISTLPMEGLTAALRARRVLAKGGTIAVLLDHRIRRGGILLDFFGRPTRFAAGPIRLALRSGAPLLPVQIHRGANGRHEIEIGAPVPFPAEPSTGAAACRELLERCVGELETMIRRSPADWAWIHPRWGSVTTGAAREKRGRPLLRVPVPALAFALAAVLAIAGCGQTKPSGAPASEYTGPSSVTRDFALTETESGRPRWVLSADSAETWENMTHQTTLRNVHVDFYNSDRQVYSVLTADKGVVQQSTNDMSASGNVRVVTTEGDTLTTDTLEWHNTKGRVSTKDRFRLGRPDAVLTGTGFDSDPGLKNYKTEDVRIDARGSHTAEPGT